MPRLRAACQDTGLHATLTASKQGDPVKERVIFGATSNLGTAVARIWAQRKDRITIVGRNADRLAILAKDLQSRGAESVEICVMNLADSQKLWSEVVELFRDKQKVDTLLVCQGVFYPGLEMSPDIKKIRSIIEVNFESVISIVLAAKSHFVGNHNGSIAVVGSVLTAKTRANNYLYASTKIALETFMSGFQKEVSPFGVKACTIVPGLIHSNVTKDWDKQSSLWTTVDVAAVDIAGQLDQGGQLFTPKYWGFLRFFLSWIPESLFYRLRIW